HVDENAEYEAVDDLDRRNRRGVHAEKDRVPLETGDDGIAELVRRHGDGRAGEQRRSHELEVGGATYRCVDQVREADAKSEQVEEGIADRRDDDGLEVGSHAANLVLRDVERTPPTRALPRRDDPIDGGHSIRLR